jgi:hypothetical protein
MPRKQARRHQSDAGEQQEQEPVHRRERAHDRRVEHEQRGVISGDPARNVTLRKDREKGDRARDEERHRRDAVGAEEDLGGEATDPHGVLDELQAVIAVDA